MTRCRPISTEPADECRWRLLVIGVHRERRIAIEVPPGCGASITVEEVRDRMLIEMRTYKLKPGTREEFLEISRTKSVPAHERIGMKILGPFVSIEDRTLCSSREAFPTRIA